jgi:hypothetical protein
VHTVNVRWLPWLLLLLQIIASLHSGVKAFLAEEMPIAYYGCFDGHCGSLAAEVAAAQLHHFLANHHMEVFEEAYRTGVTPQLKRLVTAAFMQAFRQVGRLAHPHTAQHSTAQHSTAQHSTAPRFQLREQGENEGLCGLVKGPQA